MTIDPRLDRIAAEQPYPLLFATISGAHLYGFPSPDSDYDLRGAHVLPLEKVVGLDVREETVEQQMHVPPLPSPVPSGHPLPSDGRGVLEMDIVTHDVRKFFRLLLKKNGYVLEQVFSPLVVRTTAEHAELKEICCPHPQPLSHRMGEGSQGIVTKHHAHHYFGFAEAQWKLFLKGSPRRVKPLLYVYRVLLTGIHLMRTGELEANLVTLNEEFRLPYVPELVARKLAGPEDLAVGQVLGASEVSFHQAEYERLGGELQAAHEASRLPELPSAEARAALDDLLVRVRLRGVHRANAG